MGRIDIEAGAHLTLGSDVLLLNLTDLDYDWVTPAVRVEAVVSGVSIRVPNKETLPGIEHYLATTVNKLKRATLCTLRADDRAIQAFADFYYVREVYGVEQPLDEELSSLLARDSAGPMRSGIPASEHYGVVDLLGGIAAQPIGYCYTFCWSPVAHVAVLANDGMFAAVSLPTDEMVERFATMEEQVRTWADPE